MNKQKLSRVTLLCCDTYNYGAAVSALKNSMAQCDFASVKFLTNIPIKLDNIEVVEVPTIDNKEQYSEFCIKELYKHFSTDFVMVIQHDGYVINGNAWLDEFMDYDYVAPPWLYVDNKNVGCGGASLRSYKLQEILGTDDFIFASDPEDQAIGRLYRDYLVKNHGIKFPSEDLADKFGYELRVPIYDTFCFHGYFHQKYQPTVVIKRVAALGDCVQVEPVLQYFHDKGYRVVLDSIPQFQLLYISHYFKVHRLQDIDQRLLQTAKFVNLDMSYESNPKQLHLKTYFEYACVPEEEYKDYIKNPTLALGFPMNHSTKLFWKYCVIHIDTRDIRQGRNIYGVDWEVVVEHIIKLGYTPIQVGVDHTVIIKNAIKINCTNENFLSYVVGGADLMVGIDSGIAAIAAGFRVPSVIAFGSVNPEYIHADFSNIEVVTNHSKENPFCPLPHCWSEPFGTSGQSCVVNFKDPPCCHFTTEQFITGIGNLLKKIDE